MIKPIVHKMGWCFDCDSNDCEHINNATKSLIQSLTESEVFIKNGNVVPADNVYPDQPSYYGGNKIPDSYLRKFARSVEDEGIPYDLRVFVDQLGCEKKSHKR